MEQPHKLSRLAVHEGTSEIDGGAEVVRVARTLIGVKFRHQGRDPKVGLDCIGVCHFVGSTLGYKVTDRKGYGRHPDGNTLISSLDSIADRIKLPAVGAIAAFEHYLDMPYHLGIIANYIYGGLSLIHSDAYVGKVTEISFDTEDFNVVGYWKWRH